MAALEKSRRDLPIDASLGVYTLLVVEKPSLEIRPTGGAILSVFLVSNLGTA